MKTIKFPLEMRDAYKARTIEDVELHFDGELLVQHYMSNKLQQWLEDRCYYEQLEKINRIHNIDDNLLHNICDALGIENKEECNVDVLRAQEKVKRINIIRKYTDSKEIIDHEELVAFTQTEFDRLLIKKQSHIYLLGEEFTIPINMDNVVLTGLNNPTIVVKSDMYIDYEAQNVIFDKVRFNDQYQNVIDKNDGIKKQRKFLLKEKRNKSASKIYRQKNKMKNFMHVKSRKKDKEM